MKSKDKNLVSSNNLLAGFASSAEVNELTENAEAEVEELSPKKAASKIKPGHRQNSVILPNDLVNWLTITAANSTRTNKDGDGGMVTNKTMIIKALLEVARKAELSLEGIESEEEIEARFIQAVKRRLKD